MRQDEKEEQGDLQREQVKGEKVPGAYAHLKKSDVVSGLGASSRKTIGKGAEFWVNNISGLLLSFSKHRILCAETPF